MVKVPQGNASVGVPGFITAGVCWLDHSKWAAQGPTPPHHGTSVPLSAVCALPQGPGICVKELVGGPQVPLCQSAVVVQAIQGV